jgi:hypothetical protein
MQNRCIRKINSVGIISTILANTPVLCIAVDSNENIYYTSLEQNYVYKKTKTNSIATRVRITGPPTAADAHIQISQLVVKNKTGLNVALNKPTSSSSQYYGYSHAYAVDGTEALRSGVNFFHSNGTGPSEWWEVDLQGSYDISEIIYYNRGDGSQYRANGMKLEVYNGNQIIYTGTFTAEMVQTFNLNNIEIIAGTGNGGFSGDGGLAKSANLDSPKQIVLDSSGNIYIADRGNNRIRKLTPNSNGTYNISTVAGNGGSLADQIDNVDAMSSSVLCYYIQVDLSGNLYASGIENSRIRKITKANRCKR